LMADHVIKLSDILVRLDAAGMVEDMGLRGFGCTR